MENFIMFWTTWNSVEYKIGTAALQHRLQAWLFVCTLCIIDTYCLTGLKIYCRKLMAVNSYFCFYFLMTFYIIKHVFCIRCFRAGYDGMSGLFWSIFLEGRLATPLWFCTSPRRTHCSFGLWIYMWIVPSMLPRASFSL